MPRSRRSKRDVIEQGNERSRSREESAPNGAEETPEKGGGGGKKKKEDERKEGREVRRVIVRYEIEEYEKQKRKEIRFMKICAPSKIAGLLWYVYPYIVIRHRMKMFLECNLAILIFEIDIKAFNSKFVKMQ